MIFLFFSKVLLFSQELKYFNEEKGSKLFLLYIAFQFCNQKKEAKFYYIISIEQKKSIN